MDFLFSELGLPMKLKVVAMLTRGDYLKSICKRVFNGITGSKSGLLQDRRSVLFKGNRRLSPDPRMGTK